MPKLHETFSISNPVGRYWYNLHCTPLGDTRRDSDAALRLSVRLALAVSDEPKGEDEQGGVIVILAKLVNYQTFLAEKYRPPSRGGNTKAWHQHVLTVGGVKYSFLAAGARKWAYAGDLITFQWGWDESKRYCNIDRATFKTTDGDGNAVVRGSRDFSSSGALPTRDHPAGGLSGR